MSLDKIPNPGTYECILSNCYYLRKSVLIHQVGVHYELSEEEKFYRNALTRMPDGPAALEEAYNAVEDIVGEVEQYVKVRARLYFFVLTIQSKCGINVALTGLHC